LLEGQAVVAGDRLRVGLFGPRPQDFQVQESDPEGPVIVTRPDLRAPRGQSRRRRSPGDHLRDIGGLAQEIRRIREMIELPLRYPVLFERLGIDSAEGGFTPGPPGTARP
jgi:transitional endoplasmic reticulum ATPase